MWPPWPSIIMEPPPAGDAGRGRSHRQDRELDFHRAGFFELQCRLDRFAGFERMLDVHEHQVIAAGLESHRLARLDFDAAFDRAHLHHAVVHAHRMDLACRRRVASGAAQTIRRGAVVGHRQISRARARSLRRRARPGLGDVDRADIVVGGLRSRRVRTAGWRSPSRRPGCFGSTCACVPSWTSPDLPNSL